MNELMVKMKEKKNALLVPAVGLATVAGSALPVFAEGESNSSAVSGMTTALGTAFAGVQTDVVTIITTAHKEAL